MHTYTYVHIYIRAFHICICNFKSYRITISKAAQAIMNTKMKNDGVLETRAWSICSSPALKNNCFKKGTPKRDPHVPRSGEPLMLSASGSVCVLQRVAVCCSVLQ